MLFSVDGKGYVYVYDQVLSEAYAAQGLKQTASPDANLLEIKVLH